MDVYKKQQKKIDYITSVKISALDVFMEEDTENIAEKRLQQIQNAMETLPKKCKEVFTLTKIDGLKYKEVAEKMEISIKTVEAHMGLAMRKIKEQIIVIATLFFTSF